MRFGRLLRSPTCGESFFLGGISSEAIGFTAMFFLRALYLSVKKLCRDVEKVLCISSIDWKPNVFLRFLNHFRIERHWQYELFFKYDRLSLFLNVYRLVQNELTPMREWGRDKLLTTFFCNMTLVYLSYFSCDETRYKYFCLTRANHSFNKFTQIYT